MNKQVFNPLEALERKPDVSEMQVVNIRFPGARKIIDETMNVGEPVPIKPSVKIVNKRKGPEYREQILERLFKRGELPFVKFAPEMVKEPSQVFSKEEVITVEPAKKGKRLVIRDVTIKTPEAIMKKTEQDIIGREGEQEEEKEPEEEEIDIEDFEKEINKRISEREQGIKEPILEEKEGELQQEIEEEKEIEQIMEELEPVKKKRGRKPKQVK